VRDSAALIQFLAWLKREIGMGHPVDELKAEKQIDYYRSKVDGFISLSFHVRIS
jgi:hypothetical protein